MNILLISARNIELYPQTVWEKNRVFVVANLEQKKQIPQTILDKLQACFIVSEIEDPVSKTNVFSQEEIEKIIENYAIDQLVCSQEAQLLLTAKLKEKYKISGIPVQNMLCFRDKLLMKNQVKDKVKTTNYAPAIDFSEPHPKVLYQHLTQNLGKKLFAKPVAAVGSRGVYKITSEQDFLTFFYENSINDCPYQIESYIEGVLYHVDIARYQGKNIFEAAAKYSCPNAEFQQGKSLGSLVFFKENTLYLRLISLGTRVIEALGDFNGVYHIEIFHTAEEELIFLETAIRPLGLFGVRLYEKIWQVNLYELDFYIQSNQPIDLAHFTKKDTGKKVAFLVFPLKNAKIITLQQPQIQSDFELTWRVKIGEEKQATSSNLDFAGVIFLEHTDEQILTQDFNNLSQDFIPILYENTSKVLEKN